jgi:hypothetical protein
MDVGLQKFEIGKIYKGVKRLIDSVWTTTFVPTSDGKVIILSYNRNDEEGYKKEKSLPSAIPLDDDDRTVHSLAIGSDGIRVTVPVKNPKHIFDYKMPDLQDVANDPDLKHLRGKFMAKKFFGESKILNFGDFLMEDDSKRDFAVTDLFASLARNYTADRIFYTDLLQFKMTKEKKKWKNTRDHVELEKNVTDDCVYLLDFELDNKTYSVRIEFDIVYFGKKEKDAPDTGYDVEMDELAVILEEINLKSIQIKSSTLNYSSSNISDMVKKSCENFLTKVLKEDYDSLGSEIYRLEQK